MNWTIGMALFLLASQNGFAQFNTHQFQKGIPKVKVMRQAVSLETVPDNLGNYSQLIQPIEKENKVLLASLPLDSFSVTSRYGHRIDPITKDRSFHRGIDLKTNRSKVYSMLHGRVESVGTDPLLGNFIKVQHGKYEAVYGHLSYVSVSKGESVLPGSVLGISGSTGRSTGDHLHLTIKKGQKYISPTLFIQMISRISSKEELLTYISNQ
ncbi:murein DD-endopeptidase MepM/ murein hydrolase activator NlpD [Algoriphagus iocasae]|uniref:Murein DD-endopeptidase MepM/ murein hydrolase activator NlpD n=1 Tax=Algoriphagus iocasae TaxID=1836499 RepID=A0A841MWH4_9BACT|nr:M23 family metallopeptidase [Algoriphagus iocasae]MBB6326958.1 murein DD-endopeptidase MepM/ murein hydrolase activator NlpD [Algoriphagus iocasae]